MQAASAPPPSAPATSRCPPPAAAGLPPPRRACCSTGAPRLALLVLHWHVQPWIQYLLHLVQSSDAVLLPNSSPQLLPAPAPHVPALAPHVPALAPALAVWTRAWCLTPPICQRMSPPQPHSRPWARCALALAAAAVVSTCHTCLGRADACSVLHVAALMCSKQLSHVAFVLLGTLELPAGRAPEGTADGNAAERPQAGAARRAQVGDLWMGGGWL